MFMRMAATAAKKQPLAQQIAALTTTHDFYTSMRNPHTKFEAHLCGIEHNSQLNAERIYGLLDTLKKNKNAPKPVLLMEAMQLPQNKSVPTGTVIPYDQELPHIGLNNAMTLVQESTFRTQLTGEMIALLQALRLGLDVIFCDRLHTVSVDVLLAKRTIKELEAMADTAMTNAVADACKMDVPIHRTQRAVLCAFPELFAERQRVMADIARKETQKRDAVMVVNTQHLEGIRSFWLPEELPDPKPAAPLLTSPEFDIGKQLQGRALLLALFRITNAFSMDAVTDFPRMLTEAEVEEMRGHVNMYMRVFEEKAKEAPQIDRNDPRMKLNPLMGMNSLMSMLLRFEFDLSAKPEEGQQQPTVSPPQPAP